MSIASRYAGQASAEQASRDRLEIERLSARVAELEATIAELVAEQLAAPAGFPAQRPGWDSTFLGSTS